MCYGPECCIYLFIENPAWILTSSLPRRHYSLCTNEPFWLSPERLNLCLRGCALSDSNSYNEQKIVSVFFERILQVWRGAIIHCYEYCAFVSATLLQFPPFTSKTTCNISMKAFWYRIDPIRMYSHANYIPIYKNQLLNPESQKLLLYVSFGLLAWFKPHFVHLCKTTLQICSDIQLCSMH